MALFGAGGCGKSILADPVRGPDLLLIDEPVIAREVAVDRLRPRDPADPVPTALLADLLARLGVDQYQETS